jgi:hypothetical protein
MRKVLSAALWAVLLGSAPLVTVGCASSQGATTPKGPVELDNTKWKLAVSGGRMDGRVVEFKKKGKAGYYGYLVQPGNRLRDVTGIDYGQTWVFALKPKGNNEYEGMYKQIAPDGSISEKEVMVFVDGDTFTWNLETATWELQK